jgi:hypothetical protein
VEGFKKAAAVMLGQPGTEYKEELVGSAGCCAERLLRGRAEVLMFCCLCGASSAGLTELQSTCAMKGCKACSDVYV